MKKEQLKRDYDRACANYLEEFCHKHEFFFGDTIWVANRKGEIACIGDLSIDIATIIDDIDLDAPVEEFDKWYDYCVELGMLGATGLPNFRSWLKGCPRWSREEIDKLKALHEKVDELKEELEKMLKEKDY